MRLPQSWIPIMFIFLGQVVALFLVGLGEYFVVWLGTDWEKEVQKGVERNNGGTIDQGYATFE